MTKVLIGVPTHGTLKAKTAFSLVQTALRNPKGTDIIVQMGCDVVYNRNFIVTEALKREVSHVLFVDSDMFFEPNALERMLKHDKPIVGLMTNMRRLPLETTVKFMDDMGNRVSPLRFPTELFKCYAVGAGVLLVQTAVFRKVPPPWFAFEYDGIEKKTGEDVYFSKKARASGFDVWCDPTIFVKHIGDYAY